MHPEGRPDARLDLIEVHDGEGPNGAILDDAPDVARPNDPREGRVEILAGVTPQSQVLGARFDNLKEGERAEIRAPKASMASVAASGATTQ